MNMLTSSTWKIVGGIAGGVILIGLGTLLVSKLHDKVGELATEAEVEADIIIESIVDTECS